MPKRIDIEREIARLDPRADCQRIVFLTTYLEFCWDITKALEMALFRTFAVPSIAALLDRTREFTDHTQRRYDDTSIVINEIMTHGYDSERGNAFLQRMNHIHGQYRIENDDFLYTLSTFIFVPIDWIDRFGWRRLYPNERAALFHFWRAVGERMKITGIPDSYEAFEAWSKRYEARAFGNTEAAQRVANATRDLLLSFYLPKPLWKSAEPLVYALMDEPLLRAIGYPQPSEAMRRSVEQAMRARARLLHRLPKRRYPKLLTLLQYKTHPMGYDVEDIGPDSLRPRLADQKRAAKGRLAAD